MNIYDFFSGKSNSADKANMQKYKSELRTLAVHAKLFVEELEEAGFTRDQAFQLFIEVIKLQGRM